MANTTITPNMNIPVPVPGVEPGPAWANDIVNDMNVIDAHNHTSGQGVQIPSAGLGINAPLTFNGNDATTLRSARFTAQGSPLAGAADLGCIYVSGADLYYNDEAGNQVRITTGGNVNAGAGSITGLPSGTASASYSGLASAFTWQSATNTPATMNVGNLVIGATGTTNAHTVTLEASASQSSNIAFTLPTFVPASTSFATSDTSGNMSFVSATGTGQVVLATSPTISAAQLQNPVVFGGSGTIDNTPIGSITPSTGAFTSVASGTSSVALKWKQFTGSLTAGNTASLSVSGTVTGAIGATQVNGGSTISPMTYSANSAPLGVYFDPGRGTSSSVGIDNNDGGHTNNYTVTVFYT